MKLSINITGFIASLLAASGFALVKSRLNDWWGINDLKSAIFWLVVFSLTISLISKTVLMLIQNKSSIYQTLTTFVSSFLFAYGAYFLMFIIMGGYVNAFSLSFFLMFLFGSFVQLLIHSFSAISLSSKTVIKTLVIVVFGFPLIFLAVSYSIILLQFLVNY